jgi:hypothetical protein
MSTFGNKALKNWNYQYSEEISKRFNSTPVDFQLEILKKWYPVGMICLKYDRFFKKYDKTIYEIVGYDTIGAGTIHQLKLKKYLNVFDKTYTESVTIHPTFFKPTDEWIKQMNRDNILNNLLK